MILLPLLLIAAVVFTTVKDDAPVGKKTTAELYIDGTSGRK